MLRHLRSLFLKSHVQIWNWLYVNVRHLFTAAQCKPPSHLSGARQAVNCRWPQLLPNPPLTESVWLAVCSPVSAPYRLQNSLQPQPKQTPSWWFRPRPWSVFRLTLLFKDRFTIVNPTVVSMWRSFSSCSYWTLTGLCSTCCWWRQSFIICVSQTDQLHINFRQSLE